MYIYIFIYILLMQFNIFTSYRDAEGRENKKRAVDITEYDRTGQNVTKIKSGGKQWPETRQAEVQKNKSQHIIIQSDTFSVHGDSSPSEYIQ